MQKTNTCSRFMLALFITTLTAASALATNARNTLNKTCKKNKDIVTCALKKSLKRGINPCCIAKYKQRAEATSCCSNQVKQSKAAKRALAKRKLGKQLWGNKLKSNNKTQQRKKAIKHIVNKARTQSTKGKAKSFFKNLFTGFMGMKMRK